MSGSRKVLIERVAVGVLAVVLILAFVRVNRRASAKGSKPEATPAFDIKAARNRIGAMRSGAKTALKKEIGRNPLIRPPDVAGVDRYPQQATTKAGGKLALEGIILDGKENLAIISGAVVGQGETVDGARVLKIDKDSVILLKDGSEIELKG